MTLKYTIDETKTPRVITLTSDKATLDIKWAGDDVKGIFVPVLSDPAWKLISNDGTTAVFNG